MAVLEPDEAVWAVKDAGSLTGRVGDFGLGLWNTVCGGESPILVFGTDPCAAVVGGLLAGLELFLGAFEDERAAGSFLCSGSLLCSGSFLWSGVFAGCFSLAWLAVL